MAGKWFKIKDSLTTSVDTEKGISIVWRSITHEQFVIINFFVFILFVITSAMGTLTNIINIRVFLKCGVKEGMDASFLGLSISDFVCSLLNCIRGSALILLNVEIYLGPRYSLDPDIVEFFGFGLFISFYTLSSLLTIYIALTRCACVLWPVRFKSVFTVRRTVGISIVFFLLGAAMNIPNVTRVACNQNFQPAMNQSRLDRSSKSVPGKKIAKEISQIFTNAILPIVSQVLLLACIVIMTRALARSASLRNHRTSSTSESGDEGKAQTKKLSGRDAQIVQQVVLLSIVHLVCNLPSLVSGCAAVFVPNFSQLTKRTGHFRLAHAVRASRRVFEATNATVNFWIYLKYNRKFREAYDTFLQRGQQTKSYKLEQSRSTK